MSSQVVGKKPVKLFYDVVSPYSWIAFEVLCRYRQKWNIDLIFKPFLLGGIMKEAGNKPPMFVAHKGVYMSKDLKRLSQLCKIPINQKKDVFEALITKGSLSAQRLLTAIQMSKPELLEEASRQLWLRIWSRDEDIVEDTSLREVLLKIGLNDSESNDLLEKSRDKVVSNQLKQTTQEALDAKAFGAPTIIFTGKSGKEELIFGSDRIELLAHLIGEKYEGPLAELSKL